MIVLRYIAEADPDSVRAVLDLVSPSFAFAAKRRFVRTTAWIVVVVVEAVAKNDGMTTCSTTPHTISGRLCDGLYGVGVCALYASGDCQSARMAVCGIFSVRLGVSRDCRL